MLFEPIEVASNANLAFLVATLVIKACRAVRGAEVASNILNTVSLIEVQTSAIRHFAINDQCSDVHTDMVSNRLFWAVSFRAMRAC